MQADLDLKQWLNKDVIVDDAGAPLLLVHKTKVAFEGLDPSKTIDGGLHFGTLDQASMRAGSSSRAYHAYLKARKVRRSTDKGSGWKKVIASAKRAGFDAIVYLNRYEGLTTPIIERLTESGELEKLDGMSDAQFRKAVPEARDSYIVFSTDQLWIVQQPDQQAPA